MKKLSILLFAVLLSVVSSCVSVNPATSAFSVTADILEIWIEGVPYLTIDKNQHYRNLVSKNDSTLNFFYIVPSEKKIDKKEVYEVVSTSPVTATTLSPGEANGQPIKVFLDQTDYYQRPWRN